MESIQMDVRGSMDSIIADLTARERDVVDKALPRALNKVIDQVKTGASRAMRDAGYKLKVTYIKNGLTVTRASPGRLTAKVKAAGKPVPLVGYGARQVGKGVSVDVLKGRKIVSHAFIETAPGGHKGVFVRVGKTHKKTIKNGKVIWSGLPIKQLFGPSVPDGLANAAVQESLQRLVAERFPDIFRQQIQYLAK